MKSVDVTLKATVTLDPVELAKVMSTNELIDFIKDLDEEVGSWDFTLELCDHFERLKERYYREQLPFPDSRLTTVEEHNWK